jgi:hypothetical protein
MLARLFKQGTEKAVEHHAVPFNGWDGYGSQLPQWWELPLATSKALLHLTAFPPSMCDMNGMTLFCF